MVGPLGQGRDVSSEGGFEVGKTTGMDVSKAESWEMQAAKQVCEVVRAGNFKLVGSLPILNDQKTFTKAQIVSLVKDVREELKGESDKIGETIHEIVEGVFRGRDLDLIIIILGSLQIGSIEDEDLKFYLIKEAVAKNAIQDLNIVINFVENKEHCFELAKILAAKCQWGFSKNINELGIENKDHLFQIAKIRAAKNGYDVSAYIKNYGIENKELLFEIAKIAAVQSGAGVSKYIKNYGIENKELLFEIAKIAAAQDGRGVSEFIKNYGIENKDHLFEIAKIAAAQSGEGVSLYIKDYGIENKDHLFEIAKIAAAQDGKGVSAYIENYGLENKEHLFEIAKIAAAQSGQGVSWHIKNYGFENNQKLEIFMVALKQSPKSLFSFASYEFENVDSNPAMNALQHLYTDNLEGCQKSLNTFANQKKLDLTEIFSKIGDQSNEELKKEQLLWLAYSCVRLGDHSIDAFGWSQSPYFLLKAIFDLRQPILRYLLSDALANISKDKVYQARFDQLQKNKADHRLFANLLLLQLEGQGVDQAVVNEFSKKLESKIYTDKIKMNAILMALAALEKDLILSPKEKENVLKRLMVSPEQIHQQARLLQALFGFKAEKLLGEDQSFGKLLQKLFNENIPLGEISDFVKKWEEKIDGKFRNLSLLMVYAGKLAEAPEKDALLKSYATFLKWVLEGEFQQKRYSTEGNPQLEKVKSKISLDQWKKNTEIPLEERLDEGKQEESKIDFKKIIKDKILVDKHLNPEKYDYIKRALEDGDTKIINQELGEALAKSKGKDLSLQLQSYLIKLCQGQDPGKSLNSIKEILGKMDKFEVGEFQNDIDGLIVNLSALQAGKQKGAFADLKIVNTDDPCDLFLCGTEVEGSCQRIDGESKNNKCLLGYGLNGANRLIAVKDSSGKIVARTMLRLLWDETNQTPVLFQERVYPALIDSKISQALIDEAKDVAKKLNISLASLQGGEPYSGSIQSLGGPAVFEYSDAAAATGEGGGVQSRGVYQIFGAMRVV